jgi:HPt (histidine-containing phosphotransfer) domain-containing protein
MSANDQPVFDASALNRQTRGDTHLQVEMLALFVAEVERLMQQVEDAADPQVRGERLRALVTVARNTGAVRLAHTARSIETQIGDEPPDLTPLRTTVSETLSWVQRAGR